MSGIDPRTPVIVGVGQLNRRRPDDRDAIGLMVDASRVAVDDSGARSLAGRIGMVAVLGGLWSWADPGRIVADRIGAPDATTMLTTFGGQTPQALVGILGARITTGELDVVLICGGEDNRTRRRARRAGHAVTRTEESDDSRPDESYGEPMELGSELEIERGVTEPVIGYAVLESVLAGPGRGQAQHRRMLGDLWAGFAAVASTNPHASDRRGVDAAAILEVCEGNRMVAWPYPKAMCANNDVDMAAAVVMCSTEAADTVGVPRDSRVFPWISTEGDELDHLSARWSLTSTVALADAGRAALEGVGLTIDEIEHLELYGCFPSIVEMTTGALRIDRSRVLTVTGGLGFAGSALNTSTLHGICAMAEAIRTSGGSGLVHGNGGIATKHAFGIYGATPPARPFRRIDRRPSIRLRARKVADPHAHGRVDIEGFTVRFGPDGPERAVVSCLTDDGARAWATSGSANVMERLMTDAVGGEGDLRPGGELAV